MDTTVSEVRRYSDITENKLLGGQMQEFIKAMKDSVAAFEVLQ
jgi:hypothetical protein